MRTQMYEAASSLVNFVLMSKKDKSEVGMFKHKIIRLFSLLHAMSLCVIADLHDHRFPVIDMESIPDKYLKTLAMKNRRQKPEVVYAWINHTIVSALDNGLLNVPPPILSRVFQELEKAMVEYNQVLQIMTISFPFPYAQVSVVMIWFYMLMAPVVLVEWTKQPIMAALFAFISSTCFLCLEMIAAELENPFGEDANDLPCHKFQDDLNEGLILLIEPSATMGFELGEHIAQHAHLIDKTTWRSFEEEVLAHSISSIEREEWSDDEVNFVKPSKKSPGKASLEKVQVEEQKKPVAHPVHSPPPVEIMTPNAQVRAAASKPQMQRQSSPLYLQRKEGESPVPCDVQGPVTPENGLSTKQVPTQGQSPDASLIPKLEGIRVNTDLEDELVKVLQQLRHTIDSSGGWLQQIHDSLGKTPLVRLAPEVRLERTQDSNSIFEIQI